MRYLIALLLLLVCCGFTIQTKFVSKNSNSWEIYIYPDEHDTATFIKEDYTQKAPFKKRRLPKEEWEDHPADHSVDEELYISGVLKRGAYFSCNKNDTYYHEQTFLGKQESEDKNYERYPLYYERYLNDSVHITTRYFNDGTIKSFKLEKSQYAQKSYSVEWDSLHRYYWKGEYKITTSTDTIVEVDSTEEKDIIYRTDIPEKSGKWKKYDRSGAVISTEVYK